MMTLFKNKLQELQAHYKPYTLVFKKPGGTSRGILNEKKSWFIFISEKNIPGKYGTGECSVLKGLSIDDVPEYEAVLKIICNDINNYEYWLEKGLNNFPSIRFGLETALLDLVNDGNKILFPSSFTSGKSSILINGLIWMGNKEEMKEQIEAKLKDGFTCLKLKIGAIDFEEEMELLRYIRNNYTSHELEIRVDANGAFSAEDALEKLKRLSELQLNSIEQPVKQGQHELMSKLCRQSPLPIALDEELNGIYEPDEKKKLLVQISPQYIILKPSLLGGFSASQEWIDAANETNTTWWITSALESNIGLNAIAQWTFTLNNTMPQGLGTGQLFTNNFDSPLTLKGERLFYSPDLHWNFEKLFS
jgi:o-succinylbenzoate synthase